MSFSLETFSPLVDEALDYAAQRKVVLVASIGNRNSKVDKKYANYPASYPKVVSVAATNSNDRKALFSNYGPATDVSAPGEALMSAYPGGLYAVWSGTSGAAALVSGEAALLLSRKAQKADDATKRIIDRVDPFTTNTTLVKDASTCTRLCIDPAGPKNRQLVCTFLRRGATTLKRTPV